MIDSHDLMEKIGNCEQFRGVKWSFLLIYKGKIVFKCAFLHDPNPNDRESARFVSNDVEFIRFLHIFRSLKLCAQVESRTTVAGYSAVGLLLQVD